MSGKCNAPECLECKVRTFCVNAGDEGYHSCDEINRMAEMDGKRRESEVT